jgi:hypothetical protein
METNPITLDDLVAEDLEFAQATGLMTSDEFDCYAMEYEDFMHQCWMNDLVSYE